jgi:hypothetical protein
MASERIGVICGAITGRVIAVINPDDDAELDNPRLLLFAGPGEPLIMQRISRGEYMAALSMDEVAEIVKRTRK